MLFPVLDLISFGLGVATVAAMASLGSRQAAPTATFGDAKAAAEETEKQLVSFMRFANLTPVSGNTGVICTVMVSPAAGNAPATIYSFAQKDTIPIDTNANVYQYVVTSQYNVLPLFNFSSIPWFTNVPALGAPVPVTYSAQVLVEHPGGLTSDVSKN